MVKEFKEFAMRGNVIDMAVGVIIGAAFGKIVASLVKDVVMPPIGMALGGVDFSNYFVSLSGTHVSATHGLLLVLASFAVYLMPTIAVVCIGLFLSAVTRNSAAAVVGTLMAALLMQLIGILPGLGGTEPYLLTTQFQAWQGFFQDPTDWLPIGRAAWVCAAYAVPSLFAALVVFLRRDVTGG